MLVLGQAGDLEANEIGVKDLGGGETRRVAPGDSREPDPVGNQQVVEVACSEPNADRRSRRYSSSLRRSQA